MGEGGGEEGEGILTLAYDGQDMYVQDWEHKTFKSFTTCFSFNNQFLNVNLIDFKKLNNIITGNKYYTFTFFHTVLCRNLNICSLNHYELNVNCVS